MQYLFKLALLFLLLTDVIYSSDAFFYGSKGPIYLEIDSSKIVVNFSEEVLPENYDNILLNIDGIDAILEDSVAFGGFMVCSVKTDVDYKQYLNTVNSVSGVFRADPYYMLSDKSAMLLGNDICVAFGEMVSSVEIKEILDKYHLVKKGQVYGMPNVYRLGVTDETTKDVLALANELHDLESVSFSHPVFARRIEFHSYTLYDQYNEHQANIKKIIGDFNQNSVWDFAGVDSSMTIAVIDNGIEEHEDLPSSRIINGYDFYWDDNDARPDTCESCPYAYGSYTHGMWCAGVAAASHTTDSTVPDSLTGVISLAPNSNILAIKIGTNRNDSICDDVGIASAINYAWLNGADVLSCSWGPKSGVPMPVVDTALNLAYYNGRNWKGCVIVCSAGNGDTNVVAYPANDWRTIGVGAVNMYDERRYYSQYGDGLDLMAPVNVYHNAQDAETWTIDAMGDWGMNHSGFNWGCPSFDNNDIDYDCAFGGTSAACPMVAGTAALILSRRPELTSTQVYDILRNSADTVLDWGVIHPPDSMYGYGRVDAYRALLAITRGDANNSGSVNITDASYIQNWIFYDGDAPVPDVRIADANCDGSENIVDAAYIINWIFYGGDEPPICYEY